MSANLGWCCLQLVDVSWTMHAGYERCCRVDAHEQQLMCAGLGWYAILEVCFLPYKYIQHSCVYSFADVVCHWLTSIDWYVIAMHDAGRQYSMSIRYQIQMCVGYNQCYEDKFDGDRPICAGLEKCWQPTSNVSLLLCEGQWRGRQIVCRSKATWSG